MKKKLILALSALMLVGCDNAGNDNNSKKENEKINEQPEEIQPIVELDNIPQTWKDLFTFDNVTIFLKNNLTIKKGDTYKCVGGKWYYKYQGSDTFESHSGRNIFDLYLVNYSKFTLDEGAYKATNWTADESGYLRDVTISLSDNKISSIYDVATLNSSSIISELTFYDYGTTTL